jgi:hypothetical protein
MGFFSRWVRNESLTSALGHSTLVAYLLIFIQTVNSMQYPVTLSAIALFLLVGFPAASQDKTGFYVVIEEQTNCLNLVQSLSEVTQYCLPKEPVITSAEFESVSDIKFDKDRKTKYVTLKLTSDSFKTLKTLASRLPDARLALVVDDKVVGIFDKKGKTLNRSMPITGDSPSIDWIYERLKKKGP